MNSKIEAIHDFHDPAYSREWADRFRISAPRSKMFADIGDLLASHCPADARIVELGIGPAYLAEYLLNRFPDIHYTGLDFSQPMLDIAARRLNAFSDRLRLIPVDLIRDDFRPHFPKPAHGIVSTWALHDLMGQHHTRSVYKKCSAVLNGILINADFIKPEGITMEYEKGRFEINTHLEMLKELGFEKVACPFQYEADADHPTTANNYACMHGLNSSKSP